MGKTAITEMSNKQLKKRIAKLFAKYKISERVATLRRKKLEKNERKYAKLERDYNKVMGRKQKLNNEMYIYGRELSERKVAKKDKKTTKQDSIAETPHAPDTISVK